MLALLVAILAAPPYSEIADAQTSGNDVSFVWAEQFGTSAADGARSVGVDPGDGSPIVAGYTNGTIDPEGSPPGSSLNVQPNLSAGGTDAFVRKHSRDGDWEWTRQFGSSLADDALDVAADRQGNVYVSGSGNPLNRSTSGGYIRKYGTDGDTSNDPTGQTWTKQFNGGRIQTFSVDPEGNVYVALNTGQDVFVYKYGPTGALEASKPTGAFCNLSDFAFGSAVRGSGDPSVYITGLTSGAELDDPNNCTISDGTNELFLVKFDGALNKKWDTQFGSSPGSSNAVDVAVDSGNNPYVVGYTSGNLLNPDSGSTTSSNLGGRDAFLAKFDGYDGSFEWGDQFGTDQSDFAWGVGIDPGNDNYGETATVFIAGQTAGAMEEGKLNAGANDAFVVKYSALGEKLLTHQFGTTANDTARSISYDELTKSVLVAGNTEGSISGNQNAGGTDGFLVKMRAENLDAGPPPDAQAEKTPVILVPGIGGTRINYDSTSDQSEKWPNGLRYTLPGEDAPLRDLKLADNGEDPYTSEERYRTSVGDIIRTEVGKDIYANTIKTFEEAGYVEGETLFPFPLDWRKDVRTTKGAGKLYGTQDMTLPEFIDFVRNRRGVFPTGDIDRKVDIIAHSQGGLVTLSALREQSTSGKVRKVLTLGTPVLGSPKALALLQYQADCFPGEIPYAGACIANPATVQEVVTNFPGTYQLLPSRQSQEAEGSPLVVDIDEDGDGQLDGEKPYDYWTGVTNPEHDDSVARDRNATLVQIADTFHQDADDLSAAPFADSSIVANDNFVRIIGDSLATPDYIRKYEDNDPTDCEADKDVVCAEGNIEYELEMTRNNRLEGGDQTVPLHSADLFNPDKGVDLRGGVPNFYAHGVEHGALAIDDGVLNFALSFFASEEDTPPSAQQTSIPNFFSVRTAEAEPLDELIKLAEEEGLDTKPESFSGIELITEGPISGFIEDDEGHILGNAPDSSEVAVEDIPGGDYNSISDSRSFFLNESGSYTAELRALEGVENVKLKVRTYAQGQLVGQAFFQVDPAAGGLLTLTFSSDHVLDDLKLAVDQTGDGVVDREIIPDSVTLGPAASDKSPPETTATVKVVPLQMPRSSDAPQSGGRGQSRPTEATVTLTAEDGEAGVSDTYYALPGDSKPRSYTEPFIVPFGTIVRYASVDKAGNFEALKQLVVDDTPNTADTAESIDPGDNLTRYIDPKEDADWYRFDATNRAEYRVQLHGLPADYDLTVYDEAGREISAPLEQGKRSEAVNLSLDAGSYFIKILGFEGAWNAEHPYRLKLDEPRQDESIR